MLLLAKFSVEGTQLALLGDVEGGDIDKLEVEADEVGDMWCERCAEHGVDDAGQKPGIEDLRVAANEGIPAYSGVLAVLNTDASPVRGHRNITAEAYLGGGARNLLDTGELRQGESCRAFFGAKVQLGERFFDG